MMEEEKSSPGHPRTSDASSLFDHPPANSAADLFGTTNNQVISESLFAPPNGSLPPPPIAQNFVTPQQVGLVPTGASLSPPFSQMPHFRTPTSGLSGLQASDAADLFSGGRAGFGAPPTAPPSFLPPPSFSSGPPTYPLRQTAARPAYPTLSATDIFGASQQPDNNVSSTNSQAFFDEASPDLPNSSSEVTEAFDHEQTSQNSSDPSTAPLEEIVQDEINVPIEQNEANVSIQIFESVSEVTDTNLNVSILEEINQETEVPSNNEENQVAAPIEAVSVHHVSSRSIVIEDNFALKKDVDSLFKAPTAPSSKSPSSSQLFSANSNFTAANIDESNAKIIADELFPSRQASRDVSDLSPARSGLFKPPSFFGKSSELSSNSSNTGSCAAVPSM
jgi:hypothetical protein